ncbi:hypothetical protein BO70DRAFT_361208 [Aspergillus heteromorphus CBS 117.55]|uniref:Uncharacterized protein n=1 Tax=Aspergillus heteromorphus CBS 117.55 TaxID=1448321 RepID=A0A317WKS8_9EURO|nr:uncharacterized protein BO70DRAFT_361208 [Aspergillus heteromorphus CBS 117.55]PWY84810.1 hypothetical protein BO70DRAFT_361208 [Aspergillus heteromorphus CBS 117.55]
MRACPRASPSVQGHPSYNVSRNRHQIFTTFAEYDENYIRFLNDDPFPAGAPRPFLKMHEFGPWETTNRTDMKQVGSILLAIALRAHADAQ